MMVDAEVVGRLVELEAYRTWAETDIEVVRAEAGQPATFNLNDVIHLSGRIGLVGAYSDEANARDDLILEIGKQGEDFLPLPYRVGLLAGFTVVSREMQPKIHQLRGNRRGIRLSGVRMSDMGIDRSEQPVRPADFPVERGIQIAETITNVQKLLESARPIPVCMVWHHRYTGDRLNHDEVVTGKIARPAEAFEVAEPRVEADTQGEHRVVFQVPPKLVGVTKDREVWNQDPSNPAAYESPSIPQLAKLMGQYPYIDALYIGKQAVTERVKKAEKDRDYYNYGKSALAQSIRRHRRRAPH